MAINKTTTETKNKIKANSVIALPNRPQIPAEQLKQAFVKPIVDASNSMIQELDRIVEEINAELEQVQDDITDAIDEHNTDAETTHLDIRQEITDIDNTLQNHESRIGALELFADNLETNITEEIEGALDNKADLVDGKVPLEQLPDNVTVPTIPDISLNDNQATAGKYISKIEVDATDKHKLIVTKADLPQGFSGNYDDLIGAPTIPTKTSDLENDDNFIDNSYDNLTSGLTATTISGAIDELASRINNISITDNITVSDGELTLNTINSTTLTITYTDGFAELQIG